MDLPVYIRIWMFRSAKTKPRKSQKPEVSWKKLPKERILRLGKDTNFWQMGDIGPCGPCSEIFIDQGESFGCQNKDCSPACECGRFLEIWNLVFMQYDKQADSSQQLLTQKGVDTGMGFERIAAVLQHKESVFQTDIFMPIIDKISTLIDRKYESESSLAQSYFHVLADHIRSSSMLIADGCSPSNEGRGYVLRKIIRRAALFSQKLTSKNIFPELCFVVIDQLSSVYPELVKKKEIIHEVLISETEKFNSNLIRGTVVLKKYFEEAKETKELSGKQVFMLYDTYGFPLELTLAAAKDHGYTVDSEGFYKNMQHQKEQSGKKTTDVLAHIGLDKNMKTVFTGYQELETESIIQALIIDNEIVSSVPQHSTCWVITKKSPFFIVGGGQVPDQGWININDTKVAIQEVRFINEAIAALIKTPDDIRVGDPVTSIVDEEWRENAMRNHTATHLLQGALIQLFGNQIKQAGSLVHPDYLRFDFSFHKNLTKEDIDTIERIVNAKIRENISVNIEYLSLKDAVKKGALAFFGDKYKPDNVRMIAIDNFSIELCGGTHVKQTGEIGVFKITAISSPSAGHRRIVAVTGVKAVSLFQQQYDIVKELSTSLKSKQENLVDIIEKKYHYVTALEKNVSILKTQLWQCMIPHWLKNTEIVDDIVCGAFNIKDAEINELRDLALKLQEQKEGLYCISSINQGKMIFILSIADKYSSRFVLKDLLVVLKDQYQMRGGGKGNIIQGGADNIVSIEKIGSTIKDWIQKNRKV